LVTLVDLQDEALVYTVADTPLQAKAEALAKKVIDV